MNQYSKFYMTSPPPAALLEKIILHKSKEFSPTRPWKNPQVLDLGKRNSVYFNNQPNDNNEPVLENPGPYNNSGQGSSCWNKRKFWWSPPLNSLPVEFCQETSIHGLKFVAHKKSHVAERHANNMTCINSHHIICKCVICTFRIFWIIAFCLGFIAAVLLINEVWTRYYSNPVIGNIT